MDTSTFPGSVESLPVSDSEQDRIAPSQESARADSLISPDARSSNNDPASYISIENPSPDDKRRFVLLGPLQPREQRRPLILEKYYYENKKVGTTDVSQQRTWLSYSPKFGKVFCVVCLLYGDKCGQNSLRDGFSNLVNLSHIMTKHTGQTNHIQAAKAMSVNMCRGDIISLTQRQTEEVLSRKRKEAEHLQDYLRRIIDCLRFSCAEASAIRGSDEANFYSLADESPMYQKGAGKFLNLINLLAAYDEVLQKKTTDVRESRNPYKGRGKRLTFLSNDTQNKIIQIMAKLVKEEICRRIKDTVFFSISADGTTDITLLEQMCIVVRYVLHSTDHWQATIEERVIDVRECETTTGEATATILERVLLDNNIEPNNCVGASADGASNMQGRQRGAIPRLQAGPMKKCVNIYCTAHGTNLVSKGCCTSSVTSVNIYGTSSKPGDLQKLRTFFYGNARKRSQVFQHAKQSTECGDMELAATHTIRFSAMHSATTRVLQLYPAVLVALRDDCKRREDFDAAVRAESEGLLKRFSDFETFITLMMFNKIFDIVGPLNTFLQTSGLDLALCVAEADIAEAKLHSPRFEKQ